MCIFSTLWSFSYWITIVIILIYVIHLVATWNYDYFSKRNIPYSRPVPFLGSMTPQLFGRKSNADVVWELYKKYKGHRLSGFFQFHKPITFINDSELIKMIMVKDFDHFVDHETLIPSEVDPLFGGNLFFLKDKDVHTMDMKDFFTRFASDVIATAAFGIKVNSMKDPTNEFYKAGKQLANFEGLKNLILLGYLFCSKLMTMLRIPFLARGASDFFRNVVKTNIRTREKEGIIRPDMIHLLMQARKVEPTKDTEQDENTGNMSIGKAGKLDLTDEDIVAQAVVFFLAGFETTSTLLCYTAHLLAVNEDAQVRLQSEIDDMLRETEENITYEAIQAMKYLDMVISGLHRDPELFPEPDRFDPERFSEENKSSIKPFTYMPFGIGQRSCIGNRFALMEAKVALVYLLSKFSLRVVDKTTVEITFSANNSLAPTPKGGFWLGIQLRYRKE
uniref:Cytochrome P450 n=1 Tax=Timema tahoe TaxID=61484 RepID=A0A7R9P0Q5_9NEOP|nr:unnamed protein product [Timema tahoe]